MRRGAAGTRVAPSATLAFRSIDSLAHLDRRRRIEPDGIDVWAIALKAPSARIQSLTSILSEDERERAARFVHPRDHDAFVVAHAAKRFVLAAYSGIEPAGLAFDASPERKPFLVASGGRRSEIMFNLAHSSGRALLAVTRGLAVGIDLELARGDLDPLEVGARFFHRDEFAGLTNVPEPARRELFFRYWVAKESVVKALGLGLALPLDCFTVRFAANGEFAAVESHDPVRLGAGWLVRMLPLGSGLQGAVCACGTDWKLHVPK